MKSLTNLFSQNRVTYSFVISNPDPGVAYDDLLGPDLIQLPAFPIHEEDNPGGRLLVVELEDESITVDRISEVFKKHGLEATFVDEPGNSASKGV